MNILSFLTNHHHHWGVPHERSSKDDQLVMTCYECGADRVIKINLRPFRTQPEPALPQPKNKAA